MNNITATANASAARTSALPSSSKPAIKRTKDQRQWDQSMSKFHAAMIRKKEQEQRKAKADAEANAKAEATAEAAAKAGTAQPAKAEQPAQAELAKPFCPEDDIRCYMTLNLRRGYTLGGALDKAYAKYKLNKANVQCAA